MQANKDASEQLFRHQNYSFRIVTPQYRNQVLHLTAKIFADFNPMLLAAEKHKDLPQGCEKGLQAELRFWSSDIEEFCSNNLSVMICDLNNQNEIVGVTLTKDCNHEVNNQQEFLSRNSYQVPIFYLFDKLLEKMDPQHIKLMQKEGQTAQLYAVAIKPQHTGKKLLHRMLEASMGLSKKNGFQYALTFVTNPKTASSVKRLNFDKVAEYDATQLQYRSIKIYENLSQEEKFCSMWLKRLS